MIRIALLVLLAFGFAVPAPAASQVIGDSRLPYSEIRRATASPAQLTQPKRRPPRFGSHAASADVRRIAAWVAASGDNRGLPYMVVAKRDAKVFLFDAESQILGASPALLGLGRGDESAPGIGQRRLSTMVPAERTTPAGRFEASLGFDLEQDVLWVDYDTALSLHRVVAGSPGDRRHERLASATSLDNRISYGCINVPARFYDKLVVPAFRGTVGIVYILPETGILSDVFAINGPPSRTNRAEP